MQPRLNPDITNTDRIGPMLIKLFEHWSLDTSEQLDLLGYSNTARATLSKLKTGQTAPKSRDQLERAGHLLAIHKNLRLLFPENRDLAYTWMKTSNKAFQNFSPVQVVIQQGFPGLLMVRTYLDRQRGH